MVIIKMRGFEETAGAHKHTHRHTHMHAHTTIQRNRDSKLNLISVGCISLAALAHRQANLNIPMGALRPGAGHPVKRREEMADTVYCNSEEVRRHRRHTHTQKSTFM